VDIKSQEVTFGCATRFGRDIFSHSNRKNFRNYF